MKIHTLALTLAFNTLLSHARADPTYEMYRATDGSYAFTQVEPNLQTPQAGFRAYDNWSTSTEGGHVLLRGRYPLGGHEIGDDLNMVISGPALLNDMGWSIWNQSATQTLLNATFILRLYDENRNLLFEFANPLGFTVPPRSGASMRTTTSVFARFGIILDSRCYLSLQYTDAVGADIADIGGTLVGPSNVGSSSQFGFNFTTGESINFDGTDQTNMKFFIDTAEVPTPGSATLLLITALSTAHRRRK